MESNKRRNTRWPKCFRCGTPAPAHRDTFPTSTVPENGVWCGILTPILAGIKEGKLGRDSIMNNTLGPGAWMGLECSAAWGFPPRIYIVLMSLINVIIRSSPPLSFVFHHHISNMFLFKFLLWEFTSISPKEFYLRTHQKLFFPMRHKRGTIWRWCTMSHVSFYLFVLLEKIYLMNKFMFVCLKISNSFKWIHNLLVKMSLYLEL